MSSTPAARAERVIQIRGDVTVDWLILAPPDGATAGLTASYQWEARPPAQIVAQPGGAALLTSVLAAATAPAPTGASSRDQPPVVRGVALSPEVLARPGDAAQPCSVAIWQLQPEQLGSSELVWRVHQFLGSRPAASGSDARVLTRHAEAPAAEQAAADVIVLDDANMGFRDHPDRWPAGLAADATPAGQVIVKLANPLGVGLLWDHLAAVCPQRLTAYCSVGDLRKEYAPIGQSLSWERTASDVVRAIRARADLARAARVVVSLGLAGAVVVERDGPSTLIFDPQHQEGDWERRRPGAPVGLGTAVVAALALAAARDTVVDWPRAVQSGLAAARAWHLGRRVPDAAVAAGHVIEPLPEPVSMLLRDGASGGDFEVVRVPEDAQWRIFDATVLESPRAVAARIVVDGDRLACRGLPVERIGAWASIDRTEIESMRSVRTIIHEYLRQTRRSRPLSLAVFGPPGAGKSFAIMQMAREWAGGARVSVLEFNLSQFPSPSELPTALQRVRDSAVAGALPVVFWDEFDTALAGRELGWLAQFLAPMQDGAFLEGGVARPIGPAVFIFAGGTHAAMASFKARAVEAPTAKATDFLSRLRGYVDILGPNALHADDATFRLRRALLLRALLSQQAPAVLRGGRLDIDPGVLRAFLDVPSFLHGARSMEAIVEMSTLSGTLRYERSALPPRHQLSLHVDADAFLALVETGETL